MRFSPPLTEASFVQRVNRFAAWVHDAAGEVRYVHVPTSSRMGELLIPGTPVVVQGARPGGRTNGDLILVRHGDTWVSVDSRAPSRLAGEALAQGRLPPFAAWKRIKPEVPYGSSRLDFALLDGPRPGFLEVKSVTLVEGRRARFPDAPTARGTRHMEELTRAVAAGYAAAVLFVVQRCDADSFGPNAPTDPAFAAALQRAAAAGVQVLAWRCQVNMAGMELLDPLPVVLG